MTTQTETITYHSADTPYALPDDDKDRTRLDDAHYALKEYLGGNFITPLSEPASILDLGAGSGIWAAEMARQFPNAKVVGVDVSPINKKHIPPNCSFQTVNLATDFPFPAESYDVIHVRFLLVHLPNPQSLIHKCIAALKPSGFLLLEEGTNWLYEGSSMATTPGLTAFYTAYDAFMEKRGVDGKIGPKMEGILKESGAFGEVRHVKLLPPMSPWTDDEKLNKFGDTMKRFLIMAYTRLSTVLVSSGVTPEIVEGFVREINDPSRKLYGNLDWVWAQKKA